MQKNNTGFTLIELLVVVLIIGILAAVALPQYQVAVAKSKLTQLIPAVKTLKNASEAYYLANGEYPDDVTVLDVGNIIGCSDAVGVGHIHCSNFWIDVKSGVFDRAMQAVVGFAVPGGTAHLAYAAYFDHSDYPNRIECWADKDDTIANAVCKSMGGSLEGTYGGNSEFYNANVYILQ